MKKVIIILFIIIISSSAFAQKGPVDKARGFFIAVGVGPRMPIGSFSNSSSIGSGFDVELSYTDDQYLPVFFFAKVGFDQYPGSQQFYQVSDYANFSTDALPLNLGIRYYFPPLMENIVLFMPIVEASFDYTFYQKLHQFKIGSGRSNYLEDESKIGFSAGVGLSMFMLEIVTSYNFFQSNQYLSIDLRVRLPLFINL